MSGFGAVVVGYPEWTRINFHDCMHRRVWNLVRSSLVIGSSHVDGAQRIDFILLFPGPCKRRFLYFVALSNNKAQIICN